MERQQISVPSSALPLSGFFLLAIIGIFWGISWPGMKIALEEIPVWWFRAMSVSAGAFGLLVIAYFANGTIRLTKTDVKPMAVCAIFNIIGWHLLTGYGISLMPAGRASIIAFTMPVWASLLSIFVLGEAMTRYKLAGLILGIVGLGVLIGPDLVVLQVAPIGAFFMLGAAIAWAIGTVLFKRHNWTSPVLALSGWQMLVGAIVITPGAMIFEPMPDLLQLSNKATIALAYLFVVPMVLCQWAYFKVVHMFPAAIAAIGTLAVPVVGVFSSALVLGETIGWKEFVAMALIFSALSCVLLLPALAKRSSTDK